MNNSDYILVAIIIVIGFMSLVASSRKSGVIAGYRLSSRNKHTIDKGAVGVYCKIMLLVVTILVIIGALLSQDMLAILEFVAINTAFIGYALAWEKIIKLK
jgi:hypothetical protein